MILKFLKAELSGQELQDFERWRNASNANRDLVESFRDTSTVQQEINYLSNVDVDAGWMELSARVGLTEQGKKFKWKRVLGYAAAAVVLIIGGFGFYKYAGADVVPTTEETAQVHDIMPGSKKATLLLADGSTMNLSDARMILKDENGEAAVGARAGVLVFNSTRKGKGINSYNELKTPKAGEYEMILPDGTKVWLNASSSLKFGADFNNRTRKVQLDGEAYFEVARNKNMPFIVRFNDTEVEVLGTHFNISSYGSSSKTTLLEGSVKIREGIDEKLLEPGDEASVSSGSMNIQKTDTYKSIAWKEGVFYFDEDSIYDILDQIARWYDVSITYNGKPGDKKYSGNIRRQATLKQALEMLNAVSGTEFKLEKRTVIVNF